MDGAGDAPGHVHGPAQQRRRRQAAMRAGSAALTAYSRAASEPSAFWRALWQLLRPWT